MLKRKTFGVMWHPTNFKLIGFPLIRKRLRISVAPRNKNDLFSSIIFALIYVICHICLIYAEAEAEQSFFVCPLNVTLPTADIKPMRNANMFLSLKATAIIRCQKTGSSRTIARCTLARKYSEERWRHEVNYEIYKLRLAEVNSNHKK